MNILYLGYWSVNDGLSEATIKPHLEILSSFSNVHSIVYVSIERSQDKVFCDWGIDKLIHLPFYSNNLPFLIDKISDFTILPKRLLKVCRQHQIDKIIARSSLAGAIAYLVHRKTNINYYVESFEPHAEYMLESKVWSKVGIRYNIQKYFEKKQLSTASGLMPVADNYTSYLKNINLINCPVDTIPCSVNLEEFTFSMESRELIRKRLKLSDTSVTGIYVGKFGDIYYDREAFAYFKSCFDKIEDFFLILLTPMEEEFTQQRISENAIPRDKVWFGKVRHHEVTQYLSASDIAFSPIKSTPNRKYCSATKNGEYWANGLPILIDKGIGDDSGIIINKGGGSIIDYTQPINEDTIQKILHWKKQSLSSRMNNESTEAARTHRNVQAAREVYKKIIV